ncbi:MAG TPA: N-6 DNA methylase [Acetobacteraceae bacterium]
MADGFDGLAALRDQLDWPSPETISRPRGAGPAVLAALAREKIEARLRHLAGSSALSVGVLVPDPDTPNTPSGMAIVCEFSRPAPEDLVREAHRLAWNFCRVPVLVTIEPHRLRTWSCLEPPSGVGGGLDLDTAELADARAELPSEMTLPDQIAQSLHWLSLASGEFVRRHGSRFRRAGRADRQLLGNLKDMRTQLLRVRPKLEDDLAHDLIGRLIFMQFLSDRRDASGKAALDLEKLHQLHHEGILGRMHDDLASLLSDHADTFKMFHWLDDRFNGDFFPGKGGSEQQRKSAWSKEEKAVTPKHLQTVADFVGGRVSGGQLALWRAYEFDVIPLEFVSCIYEEFLKGGGSQGVHYTPVHLADFVLDAVLPWDGEDWDLRVLDPACGSGIFLVRAFQRLVNRWRTAHRGCRPPPVVLAQLLEQNLLGVEIDPRAVRIASFSLYLAMCDEIDPRDYWTRVSFPPLRNRRILQTDFFSKKAEGVRTGPDSGTFDVVVGNPPWGKSTAAASAMEWARDHEWKVPNKNPGTVFLAKALDLARPGGRVAMIQPAGPLLHHRSAQSEAFRKRLLQSTVLEEVTDLSVLRFDLFPSAVSPACILALRKVEPDGRPITFLCPKLLHTAEDSFRIACEEPDVHEVLPWEVERDPYVWNVLAAGGRRNLGLVRRLGATGRSLKLLTQARLLVKGEGVIPREGAPLHPGLQQRRFLEGGDLPEGTWLRLSARSLPIRSRIPAHRRTNPEVFDTPQLLVKQTATRSEGRFRAVLVAGEGGGRGVVCTQSFISVHARPAVPPGTLETACLVMNSGLATYYIQITSGRLTGRTEANAGEIYDMPLPHPAVDALDKVENFDGLDQRVASLFGLDEVDVALVEDALRYTIPEMLRQENPPGRSATWRPGESDALEAYCDFFLRVLESSSDGSLSPRAVIYEPRSEEDPVRLAAIYLHRGPSRGRVEVDRLGQGALSRSLAEISEALSLRGTRRGATATVFDVANVDGVRVPAVHLLKPNEARFWTRTRALADADEFVAAGLSTGLARSDSPLALGAA